MVETESWQKSLNLKDFCLLLLTILSGRPCCHTRQNLHTSEPKLENRLNCRPAAQDRVAVRGHAVLPLHARQLHRPPPRIGTLPPRLGLLRTPLRKHLPEGKEGQTFVEVLNTTDPLCMMSAECLIFGAPSHLIQNLRLVFDTEAIWANPSPLLPHWRRHLRVVLYVNFIVMSGNT